MAEVSITIRPDEGWAPASLARVKEIYQAPGLAAPGCELEENDIPDAEPQPAQLVDPAGQETSSLLEIPGLLSPPRFN